MLSLKYMKSFKNETLQKLQQYNVKHNKTITKTEKNLNKITQKYDEAEYFLYIL